MVESALAAPPQDGPSPLPDNVPLGFWSGETLLEIQKSGVELIKPFHEEQIDCNCYTLRMGDHYFVTSTKGDSEPPTKTKVASKQDFNIPAGQFAFLISEEEVFIPRYAMAFISMRTAFKFKGLVNISGFHVDPGYKGKLIFAVFNASPTTIQITGGEPLFKIWFASIDQTSGKRHVFDKPPIEEIDKELMRGMTRELLSLQQLNDKIRDVDDAVNKKLVAVEANLTKQFSEQKSTIDNLNTIWRTVQLAVIGMVIVSILTIAWPTLRSLGDLTAQFLPQRPASPSAPPSTPPASAPSSQTTPPAQMRPPGNP
ncbi:dCTP deaminase [Bradyrhizobium sp. LB7.2]